MQTPEFLRDIQFAARTLQKQPSVTAVAIFSLALGIGANTTIFTVINAVLFSTIPVEQPEQLIRVHTIDWENPGVLTGISFPNYEDIRDGNTTIEGLAVYAGSSINLVPAEGEAQQISAQHVSSNYFDVLRVRPTLGRTFFTAEDNIATPVVVLSHGIWERRFGADPDIVGKQVNLSRQMFEVIGVMPNGFKGLQTIGDPDLVWIPLSMRRLMMTGRLAQYFELRRARFAQTVGRLKNGVSLAQANDDVHAIGTRLEEAFPTDNRGRETVVRKYSSINPNQRDQYNRVGMVLMSVVGLVLLIACANAANLLLAKAVDRDKEMAIRLALGAERSRLVRQLLTESVLLSVTAGAIGTGLAFWGRDILWAFRPPNFGAQSVDLTINGTVLGFTLLVAVVTGVVFGMVPALHASNPDLRSTLQEGGRRATSGTSHSRVRHGLVIAEVALAMVALIGAGLFVKSMRNLQSVDPGFEAEQLALFSVNLGNGGYGQPDGEQFYEELTRQLSALPGVNRAAFSSGRMLGGGLPHTTFPEGVDIAGGRGLHVQDIIVSPGYFETAGIPLIAGRTFTDFDRANAQKIAVINEATRRLFWPNSDPIGRRVTRSVEDFSIEVVGVVGDALIDLSESAQPIIYTTTRQFYQSGVQVLVRTTGDPNTSLNAIQGVVRDIDPALPISDLTTIRDNMKQALWAPRLGAGLLGVFGILAVLLAMVGIYGVMSYAVRQRHHELGLRMALGAAPTNVLQLVLRHGMTLVVWGLAAGLALSVVATRLIQFLLFGIRGVDPVTFALVPLSLLVVAFTANMVPALRVTRIDPIVVLRDE